MAWFLVGPTASGKSDIAHHIGLQEKWDIISADSMQVYRGMDIGTAKVSSDELQQVQYHGINLVDVTQRCSAWHFCQTVQSAVQGKENVVVVGGTGLYVQGLINGLKKTPDIDPVRRAYWEKAYAQHGLEWLQGQLKHHNLAAYEALENPENPRRLMRALEIIETGVIEDRKWDAEQRPKLVGLRWPREVLHERIAERVQRMYENGLLDETQRLSEYGRDNIQTASQAIGYAEAFAVLEGDLSREEAVEKTIIRTRQYARRQMTWFRNQADVDWVDVDRSMLVPDIADAVMQKWRTHGPVTFYQY